MRQLDLFGNPADKDFSSEKQSAGSLQPEKKASVKNSSPAIEKTPLSATPVPAIASPQAEKKIRRTVQTRTDVLQKRGRKSFKEMDAEADLIEVPGDDILFQKKYYAISEVAQWFKVNTSLLRFWENEFDMLKPRKNRKGDRLFRPEDIKTLQVIYYLLRQRKFSLEGAKQYLAENDKTEGRVALIQSLTKFRAFLLELKTNLAS